MKLDHSQTITANNGETATLWHFHKDNLNYYVRRNPDKVLQESEEWYGPLNPQQATQVLINKLKKFAAYDL